ncbi:MAG TPA: response regulator [Longimicrobium sp.]|nr:response regulator [Longimicrobium sp.]
MSRKILLIEDDEAARYIFSTALAHVGYQVASVRTGTEGLRWLGSERCDLVVVDIGLPDLDGFEVIRRIRASVGPDLPVLVATVHVFEHDQVQARAAGCDVFLKKPLYPRTLIDEIDRLLGGPYDAPVA